MIDSDGSLAVAKFESLRDHRNIPKGGILGLELARAAGLNVAAGRVVTAGGGSVAVNRRVDRTTKGLRSQYWSMSTFLERTEGDFPPPSYTELNEKLFVQAGSVGGAPAKEIFGRLLLNLLINNTDDHGKNTGVLMQNNGGWVLAPAFDINPVPLSRPDAPYFSKCFLSKECGELTDVDQLWKEREAFGLSAQDGAEVFARVISAVRQWKSIATGRAVRMNAADLRDYAPAFSPVRLDAAEKVVAGLR